MREHPSNAFQEFAHQMIDAGVDIIHGHSAHVVQGIEIYNGKVIMYDTGDFVDDYKVDSILRNDRSFLFNVTVDGARVIEIKLVPVLIKNMQVNVATGINKEAMLARMQKLCGEFSTQMSDDGVIVLS